jgi:hypothetical protein
LNKKIVIKGIITSKGNITVIGNSGTVGEGEMDVEISLIVIDWVLDQPLVSPSKYSLGEEPENGPESAI